jgi:hypothetical protein
MGVPALLQVFAAIVVVVSLLVIAYWQFDKDKVTALRASGKLKQEVVIFEGIKDFNSSVNEVYDTYDPASGSYKNLMPSINQQAGIEYSYNFWLYMDQNKLKTVIGDSSIRETTGVRPYGGLTTVTNGSLQLSPVVLLMRGDPNMYNYKLVCDETNTKLDVLLKNPMIKLEHGGDVISVEFNTIDKPDAVKNCNSAYGTWEVANSHKVGIKGIVNQQAKELDKKWFMVTVVIQETIPTMSLAHRYQTQCSIYINGKLKTNQSVQGRQSDTPQSSPINAPVRQPTGHLYVNKILMNGNNKYSLEISKDGSSSARDNSLMMANLSYFNYALGEGDVNNLFAKRFARKVAPSATTSLSVEFDGSAGDDVSNAFSSPMYEISKV